MILENETKKQFGYFSSEIKKWTVNPLIVKCDHCFRIFDRTSLSTHTSRKNSQSDIDVCNAAACVQWKREKTYQRKFGVSNISQNLAIQKKKRDTCFKNYGVEYIIQRKDIMEAGSLKKYGEKYPTRLKWFKEKVKHTNLKKLGVEVSTQSPLIIAKRRNNNLQKYGVINPTMLPDVRIKIKSTWLKKIYDELCSNKNISPQFSLKEFEGFSKKKYPFQCKKCGNSFENNYIGVKCYRCNPLPRSLIEQELKDYLTEIYSGKIKTNCRKEFDNKFEVDVFLIDKKIAIELNGNYYHSEISGQKDKKYHLNKTLKCEELGIHLIQIFEDEWRNRNDVVKRKINHIIKNDHSKALYARKCHIREINTVEACAFLNLHHIQGGDKAPIRLGAYYQDELISVMTFGKLRKIMGYKNPENGTWEMIRFATSKKTVGIAGKLLNHFITAYRPEKIISYTDRRWTSHNNVYEKLRFTKTSDGVPNYWYVHKTNYQKRFHRFSFRKSELKKKLVNFNPELSEWENMKNNGWDRIWDCGNYKYELVIDRST